MINIIFKILQIPVIKRLFYRLNEINNATELKLELDSINQPLNFKHYLPGTEARINRLREIVNNRTVAIVLNGPSVSELEHKIIELRDKDICYFGVNAFWGTEKHILSKIDRRFSLVSNTAPLALSAGVENNALYDYLNRKDDNILVSAKSSIDRAGLSVSKFVISFDDKLLFVKNTHTLSITTKTSERALIALEPSVEKPLHFLSQGSLAPLVALALIGGASRIVIFGGDGGVFQSKETHYRDTDICNTPDLARTGLLWNAIQFNLTMPLIIDRIYSLYKIKPVEIINCSAKSNITIFKKLSYKETFSKCF